MSARPSSARARQRADLGRAARIHLVSARRVLRPQPGEIQRRRDRGSRPPASTSAIISSGRAGARESAARTPRTPDRENPQTPGEPSKIRQAWKRLDPTDPRARVRLLRVFSPLQVRDGQVRAGRTRAARRPRRAPQSNTIRRSCFGGTDRRRGQAGGARRRTRPTTPSSSG